MAEFGITENSYTYKDLEACDNCLQKPITIANGAGVLERGAVLGMVTASHKYVEYDPAGVDGSEIARAILADDVDATAADVENSAYVQGKFMVDQLIWPTGITLAEKLDAILEMQDRGIITDKDDVDIT